VTAITIGITTRNRPESLRRCLRSIATVAGAAHDVLVFDDASDVAAADQLAGEDYGLAVRIVRDPRRPGYIVGRNTMVRQARHELVLLLDDDTVLLDAQALASAIGVLDADSTVAAIAFAQAEADGRPWPDGMQPGRGMRPCYVPAFIGFAHLLRRSVFLALAGYRESFVFYGEEKDYCLRLLAGGHRVVYLPDARIAHIPDPRGRVQSRYVRYVIRNDFLQSLYNEPWLMVVAGVPIRLHRYRRMAAGISAGDPGGLAWILGEIRRGLPAVWRDRKPVSWATVRTWRKLSSVPQPYPDPRDA
jgi:GT2 family glycosyltransferase